MILLCICLISHMLFWFHVLGIKENSNFLRDKHMYINILKKLFNYIKNKYSTVPYIKQSPYMNSDWRTRMNLPRSWWMFDHSSGVISNLTLQRHWSVIDALWKKIQFFKACINIPADMKHTNVSEAMHDKYMQKLRKTFTVF